MLEKNQVIKWVADDAGGKEIYERILGIDPAREFVVVFDLENEKALPTPRSYAEVEEAVKMAKAILIFRDNTYFNLPDELYSEAQCTKRDDDWKLIEPIVGAEDGWAVFDRKKRGELISRQKTETKKSKTTFLKLLRLFWCNGQTKNGLISRFDQRGLLPERQLDTKAVKRGRKRKSGIEGIPITPDIKAKLERGYKKFYKNGRTLKDSFLLTLAEFFRIGETEDADGIKLPVLPPPEERPSFGQFLYHCHRQRNRLEVLQGHIGQTKAIVQYGPKMNSAYASAFAPGCIYIIDSTPPRCLLVSPLNPALVIGIPTLYLITDVFSDAYTGFDVSVEEPSWRTAIRPFINLATDKVELCRRFGITTTAYEWPGPYFPEAFIGDRAEMEIARSSNLTNGFNVQIINTAPWQPDQKSLGELAFFLEEMAVNRRVPGGGPGPKNRGDMDSRDIPCLTPDGFRTAVLRFIHYHNNSHIIENYPYDTFMISDQVKPVPMELWRWGIKNRGGHLRAVDPAVVYRNLLPQDDTVVTHEGVEFGGLHFFSQYAAEKGWLLRTGPQTWEHQRQVRIAYDPWTVKFIFLITPKGEFERCPLLERHEGYADMDWLTYQAHKREEKKQRVELEEQKLQNEVKLLTYLDDIVTPAKAAAEQARKQAGIRRNAPAKNIQENKNVVRNMEREQFFNKLADQPDVTPVAGKENSAVEQPPAEKGWKYHPPADYSDILNDEMSNKQEDNNDGQEK